MSSSRGSFEPEIEPVSLMSPALAGGFFTTSSTWEALQTTHCTNKCELLLKAGNSALKQVVGMWNVCFMPDLKKEKSSSWNTGSYMKASLLKWKEKTLLSIQTPLLHFGASSESLVTSSTILPMNCL